MDATTFTVLANLGGGFALAAVILFVHRDAIQHFRKEMQTERESHERIIELILARHDEREKRLSDALQTMLKKPKAERSE